MDLKPVKVKAMRSAGKPCPLLRVSLYVGYPAPVPGRMLFFYCRAIPGIGDKDGCNTEASSLQAEKRLICAPPLSSHTDLAGSLLSQREMYRERRRDQSVSIGNACPR